VRQRDSSCGYAVRCRALWARFGLASDSCSLAAVSGPPCAWVCVGTGHSVGVGSSLRVGCVCVRAGRHPQGEHPYPRAG
jgi:hypothetical protein